jgi:hypothetical protein
MADLKFLRSITIEQFKSEKETSRIVVKQNPHTGKLFMSWGPEKTDTGAVSEKGIPTRPIVSYVKGEPTELNPSGEFWLLHDEGETLASF